MKHFTILSIALLVSLTAVAQLTRQNELFKSVPLINNKVAFVKEVKTNAETELETYEVLREWARKHYGKDPFVSSVRYDSKKLEISAKSRIELILPENSMGIREKTIMRFRIDGFVFGDKCVLEITELTYLPENAQSKGLPRVIRAEDFIVDETITEEDSLQEFRINTRKSTLYFLNNLGRDFEVQFGY